MVEVFSNGPFTTRPEIKGVFGCAAATHWLAAQAAIPMTRGWLLIAGVVYAIAILCWVSVVVIQLRMRALLASAAPSIPAAYWPLFAWWTALGSVAFCCFIVLFRLMVMKHP